MTKRTRYRMDLPEQAEGETVSMRHLRLKQRKPNTVFADIRARDPERYEAMQAKARASGRLSKGKGAAIPRGFTARVVLNTEERARKRAEELFQEMAEQDLISTDDEAANKAIKKLLQIISMNDSIPEEHPNRRVVSVADEIKAAGKLLEYTKRKPLSMSEVTVHSAEQTLDDILRKVAQGEDANGSD